MRREPGAEHTARNEVANLLSTLSTGFPFHSTGTFFDMPSRSHRRRGANRDGRKRTSVNACMGRIYIDTFSKCRFRLMRARA